MLFLDLSPLDVCVPSCTWVVSTVLISFLCGVYSCFIIQDNPFRIIFFFIYIIVVMFTILSIDLSAIIISSFIFHLHNCSFVYQSKHLSKCYHYLIFCFSFILL